VHAMEAKQTYLLIIFSGRGEQFGQNTTIDLPPFNGTSGLRESHRA
jgi:hypothetical protein